MDSSALAEVAGTEEQNDWFQVPPGDDGHETEPWKRSGKQYTIFCLRDHTHQTLTNHSGRTFGDMPPIFR
ncbi:hypothetical protein AMEX_G7301 [Astyanax mexicanus]|uniref:Uncharacterized protein n=1 Tax=Astyanax mexicanus TaxID=7994 RepID=A0A8T2LZ66_ASTMX|nr:hypothetical protein AMEX_G7301 [Astyanax mexicanus]